MAERILVVNADDFGFTRDVNAGILAAHREGIVTATTLMANGGAFDDAVRLARETPTLDVGCHLVLIGGSSLRDGRAYPLTTGALVRDLALGRWDVEAELRAQIEKIAAAGIRPLHLDTHKHTHLHPVVLGAVARLSAEFGIPWVRRPFDLPLDGRRPPLPRRVLAATFGGLRGRFHRVLGRQGCRTTDHFAGFGWTGDFSDADLIGLFERLPEGVTEFMCHPGYLGEELRAARTRLKESREAELRALTSERLRPALARAGVQLRRYRELPCPPASP